jgi:homopolymeric O-antigen transport system permease protein
MATHPTRIVIEAGREDRQYVRDLWRYRELLLFLAWRNVTVQYKQTLIGIAWAVIRPVATMLILVLVFGKLARLDPGGVDYPSLVLSGMLPWQLFATGMSEAGNSLVVNNNLVSKVYFPRLIVPLSATGVSVIDFLVTCPILAYLMLTDSHQMIPGWRLLLLPGFLALAWLAAVGAGLWLSALNVRFRDVRYAMPFIVQFGLYLSPVGFSLNAMKNIPETYKTLYALNPMVGIIEGVRWSLFGAGSSPDVFALIAAPVAVAALFAGGLWYFWKTERTFADII